MSFLCLFEIVHEPDIIIVIVFGSRNRKEDSEVQYNIITRVGTIEYIISYR